MVARREPGSKSRARKFSQLEKHLDSNLVTHDGISASIPPAKQRRRVILSESRRNSPEAAKKALPASTAISAIGTRKKAVAWMKRRLNGMQSRATREQPWKAESSIRES
jgi:hypothetical protein